MARLNLISVKFKNSRAAIASQKMEALEIQHLLSEDGKGFKTKMKMDKHLVHIGKYVIKPNKNHLIINARVDSEE